MPQYGGKGMISLELRGSSETIFIPFRIYSAMKHKSLRITQADFLLANRRASRNEEIQAHGKQITFRTVTQKSKKVYDRNVFKRAVIKSDDGSFYFS